jgi:hypothetical protein
VAVSYEGGGACDGIGVGSAGGGVDGDGVLDGIATGGVALGL